ncbi:hypothetical protein BAUCODRAFT_577524 [Baudoinia panamericana UAMH 10762]|uniref:Meiotically up-regulated protein Msb1/Mug8 domain-containing protein n=1 Tax=Baudoinia panamericana (strain UAMH 10762) TaxID=717646 RepID=M2N7H3_BAUPA|nr:uncharacterized protein BAUCODRAFT_577524 [Baudoinia panamericana UAMH 10762]EMC95004.1 hypothetical protein BAUCODRAFT_577524 [Baudoinia panamericana UAMH 10762]
MPLFSRFKNKGGQPVPKVKPTPDYTNGRPAAPVKARYQSTWSSKTVELMEVEELVHLCTAEMKSRGEALDAPFLLLPFRPDTDASGARTFIRNFFKSNAEGSHQFRGSGLAQELRLTEAVVLCSIIKWCWSRMPGGVVTWPVYEGFQIGEKESKMARNAFDTFIPIGAGSEARKNIIFDFFDLLAAVAAHGKTNGLGGRKLSRLAGWWAFEHSDDGKGFEGGYKSWTTAADATSHLFFAYLRSLSPEADPSLSVIERIPRSLQALLASTEYPPETPTLLQRLTPRVVMLVDSVSPTPFALLRRAKHFEYRDNDRVLRAYSEFDDPLDALTDECKRVLYAVSSTNSAAAHSRHGVSRTTSGQETWSNFQNLGFSDLDFAPKAPNGMNGSVRPPGEALKAQPRSRNAEHGRPTTPSWADFLSAGFSDDDIAKSPTSLSLPSDRVLPPIGSRTHTPSHAVNGAGDDLAPGEMAAITDVELDDAFWWVWMTSLSSEEPADRKAVFGRCALIETTVLHGRWLIMEEQVKGASPEPAQDAYIAPKKGIFGFTKRGKAKRTKSDRLSPPPNEPIERVTSPTPSKSSLAPDQTSKIKQAAAALARRQTDQSDVESTTRRGRHEDNASAKTSSMLTLGMMTEASPAMKWAHAYDKNAIRAQYLGDSFAGKGMDSSREDLGNRSSYINMMSDGASSSAPSVPALSPNATSFPADGPHNRDLPSLPNDHAAKVPEPQPVQAHPAAAPQQEAVPMYEPPAPGLLPSKPPEVSVHPAEPEEDEVPEEVQPITHAEAAPAQPTNTLSKEIGVPSSPTGKVSRKPVPPSGNLEEHPAFRQRPNEEPASAAVPALSFTREPQAARPQPQVPQSPTQNAAAVAAQRAMAAKGSSSPESLSKQPKNKKQLGGGGGAGLKKLFNRKKDGANRQSLDIPAPNRDSLAPPSETNLGRRLSLLRRKGGRGGPNGSQIAIAQPAPETIHEPMPELPGQRDGAVDMSDARSDANPEEEFSRFDQGPIAEMPSASPAEDVPEIRTDYHHHEEPETELPAPTPQRHFNTQLASRIAPGTTEHPTQEAETEAFVTPLEHSEAEEDTYQNAPPPAPPAATHDAQSEVTMDEHEPAHDQSAAEQDRWAKIRENAARRAAMARGSEEHSMQSRTNQSQLSRETDDGETSGEETIESRVARIKARVAELTSGSANADSGSANGVRK